ncbi:carboxypeptidase-like regulatory domain-containing protein [Flagellimonas sp. S174]|uniref:carboxypeptidase-like regulatory domain-containing protein n=1 Tax=Flagellimonas sp. S174 TaxID=3410790 RepID=UPI003BF4BB43
MSRLKGILLFWVSVPLLVSAQKEYKGRVLDAKTNTPIPYVNIGIVNKGIGTVTDEEGLFHLSMDAIKSFPDENILFSSLGYKPFKIPVSEIELVYNEYPVIKLSPEIVQLNEVVVTNAQGEFIDESIGYKNSGETIFGYWKDNVALGGQLATRIMVKKGLRKLHELGFEIWSSTSDSVLLRINFYDVGSFGKPSKNLNTSRENILYTVKKGQRFADVDLRPFSVFAEDDFIVSLELLKVYGSDNLGLIMAAIQFDTDSFRKFSSQDEWETLPYSAMAFYLKSSVLVSGKAAERINRRNQRKKNNLPMISGFSIHRGKMITNVSVRNIRTKELVYTDVNGRYAIHAKYKDVLCFEKEGYETKCYETRKKSTLNAQMYLAEK